jgi:hypothetical protein
VLSTDTEAPVVAETTVSADLLEALEVVTELGVDTVGEDLAVLAIDNVALPVEEPAGDLVCGGSVWRVRAEARPHTLQGVLDDGNETLKLLRGEVTGALGKVDIGLLADQVGVSATDTLDLGQGVHDLLLAIDVRVQQTDDVLEAVAGQQCSIDGIASVESSACPRRKFVIACGLALLNPYTACLSRTFHRLPSLKIHKSRQAHRIHWNDTVRLKHAVGIEAGCFSRTVAAGGAGRDADGARWLGIGLSRGIAAQNVLRLLSGDERCARVLGRVLHAAVVALVLCRPTARPSARGRASSQIQTVQQCVGQILTHDGGLSGARRCGVVGALIVGSICCANIRLDHAWET